MNRTPQNGTRCALARRPGSLAACGTTRAPFGLRPRSAYSVRGMHSWRHTSTHHLARFLHVYTKVKNNSQMFTQYTQSLHTFITKEWYYIIVKRRYADSTATIAQPSEPKAVGEANATDE